MPEDQVDEPEVTPVEPEPGPEEQPVAEEPVAEGEAEEAAVEGEAEEAAAEEESEGSTAGGEEEESEGPEIDEDSPLQGVLIALDEIEKELKRVRAKNITNLKYELQFKIYPIIKMALEGILGWIFEEEEEEEAEEALAAGVDELREVCTKILLLAHDENAPHAEILGELAEWAKEKLSQFPEEDVEGEESSEMTEEALAEQRENDDE